METMSIQSVAEKNIVSVVLADIQPSNYNPRKIVPRSWQDWKKFRQSF